MSLFTRSAYGDGAKFTAFYKKVQETLKKNIKHLDSKHKKICEDILKEGDVYFKPYKADSLKDYETLLKEFVKKHEKSFEKVEDYIREQAAA